MAKKAQEETQAKAPVRNTDPEVSEAQALERADPKCQTCKGEGLLDPEGRGPASHWLQGAAKANQNVAISGALRCHCLN